MMGRTPIVERMSPDPCCGPAASSPDSPRPAAAVPAQYRAERADASTDQREILGIWKRNRPNSLDQRFSWMYGPDSQAGARAWLLHSRNGIVGTGGLATRVFRSGTRTWRAGQAVDLVVDRGHRTVGPALVVQRAVTGSVAEGDLDCVYGFPNGKSDRVMLRAGYVPLGQFTRWTRILKSESQLEPYLSSTWMVKGASCIVDATMRLRAGELFYRQGRWIRTEVRQSFDDRFDRLWEAVSGRPDIVGERTARYLNWRFARCPHRSYHVLCVERLRGHLIGYIVYYRRENSLMLADVLTERDDDLDVLIPEFLRHARSTGAVSATIAYVGWESLGRKLHRYSFLKRQDDAAVVLFVGSRGTESERQELLDRSSWYLTGADGDV